MVRPRPWCARAEARARSQIQLELEGAERTALGPLHARALDARRPLSLLRDAWAAELAARLAHDYGAPRPAGITAVVRTHLFDAIARAFLRAHPRATVADVGAGLNTRFERLDNGTARWFDIDRPRVTALRRRLLPVSGRRMHVAASILEPSWLALVATAPGPHCFLLEAVLGYLPRAAVRPLLAAIAGRFPRATIAFDLPPRWLADRDDARHAPPLGASDIPAAIARWAIGARVTEVVTFLGAAARDDGASARPPRVLVQLEVAP